MLLPESGKFIPHLKIGWDWKLHVRNSWFLWMIFVLFFSLHILSTYKTKKKKPAYSKFVGKNIK